MVTPRECEHVQFIDGDHPVTLGMYEAAVMSAARRGMPRNATMTFDIEWPSGRRALVARVTAPG